MPTSGFPLLLAEDSFAVDWESLYYFLDCIRSGTSISSIGTYARHLVDFTSQLEVDRKTVREIDDDWLYAYKHAINSRENPVGKRNSGNYAAQVLRSVVNYLDWLESNEFIHGVVGDDRNSRVRIKRTDRGVSHFLAKDKRGTAKVVITPRREWIDLVKAHGPERSDLASRFELMIDWCKSLGLRAMEVCALEIDQLPTLDTAIRAIERKTLLKIRLTKTKGRRTALIPVTPLLVKSTWDYINTDRQIVVKRLRRTASRRHEVYYHPQSIFLSDKTGNALSRRSFSNAVRRGFLKAVDAGELTLDERVWAHGLRHNFAANLLKAFDAAKVKEPEELARQITRHKSESALEAYLTDRFNDEFDG